MKLSLAIFAATAAAVSGKRVAKKNAVAKATETDFDNVKVKADSKTGHKLMSKARRLGGSRQLNQNDGEMTWVAGYSLKFHSCQATQNYYGGQFEDGDNNADMNYQYYGGDGQQNQNQQGEEYNYYVDGQEENANAYGADENQYQYGNGYYDNEERDDYEGMYNQNLVHFKLCPSDSCWRCKNGADYVVTLSDFVDAMLEAKMTAAQYDCERVRENCWCEDAYNENDCLASCYKNAGIDQSLCQEGQNENEFDIQEALECKALDVEQEAVEQYYYSKMYGNQNMNNGQYNGQQQQGQDFEVGEVYVGPYCAKNGKKILLGAFMDETCSYPAPNGMYEALNYGTSLPYSKKSIIGSECISCKEPAEVDYQNYWDQQDPDEVTDVCSNLYEISGKCEEGLGGYYGYRDNSGCGFIKSMTPGGLSLESATNIPAKVFASIFAVTTGLLALASLTLYKKNQRQNVSLAGTDGALA